MVCCLMSGLLLVRQTRPLNNLCLALLAVLLLDPLAPQSAGFWLSFTAVALLLTLPNPAGEVTRYGQSLVLLRTQYALFLGLAPVMLILFRQVNLLAPLVNLVAIPFIGLLVVPLCLLALALVATLAHGYRGQRLAPGSFQLDILDVGQGLAVTIATRHHLLLYDTGPAYSPRFNAGEGIIVPFLAAVNLGVPDLVIISHGDSDHAGGIAAILAGRDLHGRRMPGTG